jgi:hypothetical protein
MNRRTACMLTTMTLLGLMALPQVSFVSYWVLDLNGSVTRPQN